MGAATNIANTTGIPKRTLTLVLVILVLIALLILYRKGPSWWAQLFRRDLGDYSNPTPSDTRKKELEEFAREGFRDMSGLFPGDKEVWMEKLNALNDTELKYTAEFFPSVADGGSLKQWIDDELMPFASIDETLIARLNQMNL